MAPDLAEEGEAPVTYKLPLLGHDMPEWAPLGLKPAKAKVFKTALGWAWAHPCTHRSIAETFGISSHAVAISMAVQHVRRCRP
jgi:hypothetical protein